MWISFKDELINLNKVSRISKQYETVITFEFDFSDSAAKLISFNDEELRDKTFAKIIIAMNQRRLLLISL